MNPAIPAATPRPAMVRGTRRRIRTTAWNALGGATTKRVPRGGFSSVNCVNRHSHQGVCVT